MSRKRVFDTLIELSRTARDEAAAAAAQSQRNAEQAAQVVAQLRDYRREYDQRNPKRLDNELVTVDIEMHQRFVDKLDVAINDQVRRHQGIKREHKQRELVLTEVQRRLKAFETVQQRRDRSELAREARREQRATDELATRLSFWRDKP